MFDLSGPHICTHAYHSVRAAAAAASVSMAACAAVSCSPPQELTNPFPRRMRLLRCLTLWSITAGQAEVVWAHQQSSYKDRSAG